MPKQIPFILVVVYEMFLKQYGPNHYKTQAVLQLIQGGNYK